jgi:GYF domain 2
MNDDNFYSINRLVDFGMSIAIAQQMVKTMNHAMSNMQTPIQSQPPQSIYYAIIDGSQAGPFSESETSRLIAERKITVETNMWKPGMMSWQPASKMPDVLRLVVLTPPPFNSKI